MEQNQESVEGVVNTAGTADGLSDGINPQWGDNAPRGARAVLGRILKEGASVPLFLGQTLVNSLRDTGYNTTTSAVCEHVDNSVESGATEVRVYFAESGPKNKRSVHVAVVDNGRGMEPRVLKVACAFGGSMRFENRKGIGRYGMGMKAAALSMSPVMEVYSWQERGAFYNMTLDVDAIGQDKSNLLVLPEPELVDRLPPELTMLLTTPMVYPKHADESQAMLCREGPDLSERLGAHGTIVFMPECDRLTYRKISTLVDDATREMSRVYRRQLDRGVKLYINNRLVEPFDPTYQMASARHNRLPELEGKEKSSRLIQRWTVNVPVSEGSEDARPVTVRLYFLPIKDWSTLPRKVLKNDLKVFEVGGISFMRGDREVDFKGMEAIVGKRNTRDSWWRLEVDFHGDLDEGFGVAMNKQGVRPKSYVQDIIATAIEADLRSVRKAVEQFWSDQATENAQSSVSAAEQKANETEALQATLLPQPSAKTEQEQRMLDENLRMLAVGLQRDGENEDQAFERVKGSRFITTYKHDEDAAFYRVDFKLGKVILTINTAHAFYDALYRPLADVSKKVTESSKLGDGDAESLDASTVEACSQVLTNLQLLLLSLGRTQSEMTASDTSGDVQRTFDKFRRQWSLNLETQLTTG